MNAKNTRGAPITIKSIVLINALKFKTKNALEPHMRASFNQNFMVQKKITSAERDHNSFIYRPSSKSYTMF